MFAKFMRCIGSIITWIRLSLRATLHRIKLAHPLFDYTMREIPLES